MAVLNENNKRKKTAYVFASESGVCRRIIDDLKQRNWYVYEEKLKDCCESKIIQSVREVKETAGCLDMVILGDDEELADLDILGNEADLDNAAEKYGQNVNLDLQVIHYLLPLLDAGEMKRICYVNSVASSNSMCYEGKEHIRHMIGAARNMQAVLLKNRLQPEGYTFRIFCCRKDEPKEGFGKYAADYFISDRSLELGNSLHSDENRLVMRDEEGREVPW